MDLNLENLLRQLQAATGETGGDMSAFMNMMGAHMGEQSPFLAPDEPRMPFVNPEAAAGPEGYTNFATDVLGLNNPNGCPKRYGPQYTNTQSASARIAAIVNQIQRASEQEIDANLKRHATDDQRDLCIASIIVAVSDRNRQSKYSGGRSMESLLKEQAVVNGSYILPLELLFTKFGNVLDNEALIDVHNFGLEVLAPVMSFTSCAYPYVKSTNFWAKLNHALQLTMDLNVLMAALDFLIPVYKIDGNMLFREKLYVPILEKFAFYDDEYRNMFVEMLCDAISNASVMNVEAILFIHKRLSLTRCDLRRVAVELGIWALHYGYDKYGYMFEERQFHDMIKMFDSKVEMQVNRAFVTFAEICTDAPEKVYDPAALLTKVKEAFIDRDFCSRYPKSAEFCEISAREIVATIVPKVRAHPKFNSMFRINPKTAAPRFINRKGPVTFPTKIKYGNQAFVQGFPIIKKLIKEQRDPIDKVYTAQAILNYLNYVRLNESKDFSSAVKSAGVIQFIAEEATRSPSQQADILNTYAECLLECVEDIALHGLLKRTNVVDNLRKAIQRAASAVSSAGVYDSPLGSRRACADCLNVLNYVGDKVSSPSILPTEDAVSKIGTPAFNPEEYNEYAPDSLLEAGFLTTINCESDFTPFLNPKFIKVIHDIIAFAIQYKESDFTLRHQEYFEAITPTGPPTGSLASLYMRNCPVAHPEVFQALAAHMITPHEMTHNMREDRAAGRFADYPEFEQMVDTKDIKYFCNGIEVPPYLPVCAVIQSDPERKTPTYEMEFVDKGYESGSFPEENIYGKNAFNKKKLSENAVNALDVLKNLFLENQRLNYKLPVETFHNEKIVKLFEAMLEYRIMHLTFTIPQWMFTIMTDYQFVLPMDVRLKFLRVTVFLCAYTKFHLAHEFMIPVPFMRECPISSPTAHDDNPKRFRIERHKMLQACSLIIDKIDSEKKHLEIIFSGEEGTGRGPTAEFFALCSNAFSEPSSDMWVDTPLGLMPKFHGTETPTAVLDKFTTLGRFVSRGLYDKFLVDIKISPLFFETLLNCESEPEEQIRKYDPSIAKTFEVLRSASPEDIADMDLTFTDPRTGVDLIENGSSTPVTKDNAEEYIENLTDAYIGCGIFRQVSAFKKGLLGKLSRGNLKNFTPLEWSYICGNKEDDCWDKASLDEHITTDSGTKDQLLAKRYLIQYLAQLDHIGRRKFLEFATGSPRLPLNGFAGLDPKFRIDPVYFDDNSGDEKLPIVLTCMNSLRAPLYSSYELFVKKLSLAIDEGCKSFSIE